MKLSNGNGNLRQSTWPDEFAKISQLIPVPSTFTPLILMEYEPDVLDERDKEYAFPWEDMRPKSLNSTENSDEAKKLLGMWRDAIEIGWCVFYALLSDEDSSSLYFYATDSLGAGDFESEVRLVPTVYCKACGNRMVARIKFNIGPAEYFCSCGMKYHEDKGWL